MRRILFPTDYSETADNAFRYALQLADKQDARLCVLHVYNPPVISGRVSPGLVQEVQDKYQFDELREIKAQTPKLEKIQAELGKQNVDVFLKVEPGYLLSQIRTAIAEHNIDYIVMGTEGHNRSRGKFLGNNTLDAIEKSGIPVLSIPKEAAFKRVHDVVFLTNFSKDEAEAIEAIVEEGRKKKFAIRCVHLRNPEAKDYKTTELEWKERYKEDQVSFHVFSSRKSDIKALISYLRFENVDLVSIVHRPRHFFEKLFSRSLTIQLARRMNVPFLVFRG